MTASNLATNVRRPSRCNSVSSLLARDISWRRAAKHADVTYRHRPSLQKISKGQHLRGSCWRGTTQRHYSMRHLAAAYALLARGVYHLYAKSGNLLLYHPGGVGRISHPRNTSTWGERRATDAGTGDSSYGTCAAINDRLAWRCRCRQHHIDVSAAGRYVTTRKEGRRSV